VRAGSGPDLLAPGRYIPGGPAPDWWPLAAAKADREVPGVRGAGAYSRGVGRARYGRVSHFLLLTAISQIGRHTIYIIYN